MSDAVHHVPQPDDDAAGNEALSYAAAVRELEQILERLESDEIDIDVLAAEVRRAAGLIRLCRSRIDRARVEIEQVVVELDGIGPDDGPPSGEHLAVDPPPI
jgi:exodeoxyribonuclease VII small subunit